MIRTTTAARILVVDDEPGTRDNLRIHLTRQGYQVVTAINGKAAAQALSQAPFDLVITDLVMPGGDGYAVMDHIDQHGLDTIVIVITGYGSMGSAIQAMRRGAMDYIQKPFELELLNLAVERALERQRLARELDKRIEQLGALAEITQAITSNLDIEQVYQTLAREAGRMVNLDHMVLSLLTPDGQHLHRQQLVAGQTSPQDESELLAIADTAEGWVIERRQAFLSADTTREKTPWQWADLKPPRVCSVIVAPLIAQEKAVGTLFIGHRQPDAYSDNDLAIIEHMAGQLAIAIENTRLVRETRLQLETLQHTQTELIRTARLAAVGELARGLAHELNNPLSIVLGMAQYLQTQADLPPKASTDLTKIVDSALRMADLVRNFAEFARPASGGPHMVDINAATQQALTLMHSRLSKNNITVDTALASPPPFVTSYSHQIEQVLINLLLNADEAITCTPPPPDGHCISVSTWESSDEAGKNWVHIAVSDTGCGIDAANLPRIFDPGYTTKVENGKVRALGMGLYVGYGLVQAHEGHIDVQSQPGRGSCFTVRLPAATR